MRQLFLTAALLVLASCNPPDTDYSKNLPWLVEINAQQHIKVFGITLSETPLKDIAKQWRDTPGVALFESQSGELSLEAYFNKLRLDPFDVRIVLELEKDQNALTTLKSSSITKKIGPSGDIKYLFDEKEMTQFYPLTVSAVTYIPSMKIDAAALESRFGKPDKVISPDEITHHWLYAKKGLIATIHDKGKDVFYYVNPDKFDSTVERIQSTIH